MPELSDKEFSTALEKGDLIHLKNVFPSLSQVEKNDFFISSASKGSIKFCEFFFDNGCDPGENNFIGFSPAAQAVKDEGTELLRFLLEKGMDPNATGSGDSLLSWACRRENSEAVELLLSFGADQNKRFHKDLSPPLYSAVHIHKKDFDTAKKIVELLVAHKPDFGWKKNKLSVTRACELGNFDLARVIIDACKLKLSSDKQYTETGLPTGTPLSYAIKANDIEFAQYLIDKKAPVSVYNGFYSYFENIIDTGSLEMFELLVRNGAVRDKSDDIHGYQISRLISKIDRVKGTNPSKQQLDVMGKIKILYSLQI